MTRRKPRIVTVEQADQAMERLGWLRHAGHPNSAIREMLDCYTAVRAEVHRLQALLGQDGKPGWTDRISKTK